MSPFIPEASQVLEQYEALRREALSAQGSVDRGLGLSLFLTRGMSEWLAALTALMPRSLRPAMSSAPPPFERWPVLVPSVRSDLTTLLADMVLACSVEVAP